MDDGEVTVERARGRGPDDDRPHGAKHSGRLAEEVYDTLLGR